ncbi:MAG: DNA-directed RNA polymerase subunit beta [Candidatus Gracilibacteria bacterium]|jgi:DNA-directed RNA polymerase subunit beta|nr:DNA-directed RNA polymerase subunit beta [Candidatus Gracilibacteria bacterium]
MTKKVEKKKLKPASKNKNIKAKAKKSPEKKPIKKTLKPVKKANTQKKPMKVAKKTAPKIALKNLKAMPKKTTKKPEAKKEAPEKKPMKKPTIIIPKKEEKITKKPEAKIEKPIKKVPKKEKVLKEIPKKIETIKRENSIVLNSKRTYLTKQIDKKVQIPELIEVQLDSYEKFITEGVRELLDEISPIVDFSGKKLELHFLDHAVEEPKYDAEISRRKNITYEAPLKVHVQLINKGTGEIKEQDVFLGNIPLMTDKGTFIINGIERVVVSQIVRAPGVFFSENPAARGMYCAKIIPKRGAWLEIETDKKGIINVKIDRKRKIPLTSLLRVVGFSEDKDILDLFKNEILDIEHDYILNTLEKDNAKTVGEAYQQIYKKIRPGDLATPENAKQLIDGMFFDYRKYDMGPVARYKLNKKFKLDTPNKKKYHTLQVNDLTIIVKHLLRMNNGLERPDDIDHLANRRVRAVGELVQNKFRVGLLRTDRIAKDRMTVMDLETVTPTQLINSRPITAALREFFASSQLSQFMDQTNPLAELEHKRRLSAMGPGGLSRERASFDVRDVHESHYGRICPVATPEGPNIGLVIHLATYAKINEYGFIETPFRTLAHSVKNNGKDGVGHISRETIESARGKTIIEAGDKIDEKAAEELVKVKDLNEIKVRCYLTDKIEYYDADEEKEFIIAQANSKIDEVGQFLEKRISTRKTGEPYLAHVNDLTHIDVSPKQILSITTALIPFVEHDDNTRASMGTNMQRQAVSLLNPDAPVVGTGIEEIAAKSSGQVILAAGPGTVSYVDAELVTVIYDNGRKINYKITNYERSNQGTCIHQRVRVKKGDKVVKGTLLADGPATQNGELALGKNITVAYMAWEGYNYEDAIVLSDNIVRKGIYDSIHIETFTLDVRETKLGPEVITKDIPNVSEAKLKDLDADGIVRIGATVHDGDILVGKITPKGETELTAEERLLRAIFGEKARDVKDSSLRLPGGKGGKVIGVQIFTKEAGDELPTGILKQIKVNVAQTRKIQVGDKMAGRHGNKGIVSIVVPREDMPFLPDGTPVDIVLNPLGVISRMNIGQILETHLGWAASKRGITIATPPLNGITTEQIENALKEEGLPTNGKSILYNGKTGDAFDRPVTVGTTYMLKLSHLVEDKIHARSVGPYSLVTQQPLGGKAQHGGQRFGEMEVWALEAYGAAHTLQEMLTIKSDDTYGRSKAYESIVKGEGIKRPRVPQSFNVLVKELQSLGLSVKLMQIEKLGDEMEKDEILEESFENETPINLEIEEKIVEESGDTLEEDLLPIKEEEEPLE